MQEGNRRLTAGERLDRIPYGPFHRKMLALIGAGMFLDGFELYMTAGVMAALVSTGFSTMELNAAFVSATFFGMLLGAWSAGILGDRFGRRFTYQFNLLLFGAASVIAFFAPNMEMLIGLRFFMGLGLGAEVVCSFAMLSEFVPPQVRGRMIGWLAFLTNLPLFVTGLLNLWIIPKFGWEYMFLIGGVAALIIWFLRKSMPESPRWLELQGRTEEADAILQSIEAGTRKHAPVQPEKAKAGKRLVSEAAAANGPRVRLATLFSRPYIGKTLTGMLLHSVVNLCFYGFIGWMPSFFVKQGATVATSLVWTTVMALGAPVGALIGLSLSDRIGRKPSIIASCLLASLFGAAMPFVAGNSAALMAAGFSCFTAIYVLHAVGYALYVPEMFPTEIRLRGVGVCSSVARLSTAGVQTVIVALFAWGGVMAVVGAINACLILLAAVVAIVGTETRGKTLEQIADTDSNRALIDSVLSQPAGARSVD